MTGLLATGYVQRGQVVGVWTPGPPPPSALAHVPLTLPFLRVHGRSFSLIRVGPEHAFWLEYGTAAEAYRPTQGHRLVLKALRRHHLDYAAGQMGPFGHLVASAAVYDLASLQQVRGDLLSMLGPLQPKGQTLAVTVTLEILNNLWRHGQGGFITFWRSGSRYTLVAENQCGAFDFGRLASPLLHPCPSPLGKGLWLLLALGARLHVLPGPPVTVAVSFAPEETALAAGELA